MPDNLLMPEGSDPYYGQKYMPSGQELRAYQPTWRDRLGAWFMGDERTSPERNRLMEGLIGSRGLGETGPSAVDFTPAGIPLGVNDAWHKGDDRGMAMAIFGGPMAKTADRVALKTAEEMAAKGLTREQIFKDTGWFKGVDGKWRFEIDDSGAMIPFPTQEAITERGYAGSSALYAALKHPELLDAYPDLRRHSWSMNRSDVIGGSYERYPEGRYNTGDIKVSGPTNSDRLSVMLHEAQHGVQANEGFAPGAGANTFVQQSDAKLARDALSWRREMERHKGDWSARDNAVAEEYKALGAPDFIPEVDARNVAMDIGGNPNSTLEEIVKLYGLDRKTSPYTPRQMYDRTAGEVEARAVQKRMDMTPDQRRARPPWLDYDVPEQDQIVRFGGSGPQMSMEPKNYFVRGDFKPISQFDTSQLADKAGIHFYETAHKPDAEQAAKWYGPNVGKYEVNGTISDVTLPKMGRGDSYFIAKERAATRAASQGHAGIRIRDPEGNYQETVVFNPNHIVPAAAEPPPGIRAYHGSPHDPSVDEAINLLMRGYK